MVTMGNTIQAPRGTQDVLPSQSGRWQFVESTARETAPLFGFTEIRTPVFEQTELFLRSVGETTDVVNKEMYTFADKGGRSITLRPEGTAGVVRAMLEHGLLNGALPVKTAYFTSCYRYEKPQAGRLREFHQFGVEAFGAASPTADVEVIALTAQVLERLGLTGLRLELNYIGCPACRAEYHKALKAYFEAQKAELCATCRDRLDRNPMRILDCKSPVCREIAAGAPVILDFLCGDCRAHFDGVKAGLQAAGLSYTVNPTIVRGLDYYTRTVFEFVSGAIGAQGTVCGGGRYDGLCAQMGGPDLPALGFGMGLERVLLVMEAQNCPFPEEEPCEIYIGSIGEAAARRALALCDALRREGFFALCDTVGRSVKAQMKYADKIGAKCCLMLGDDELAAGKAMLKDMKTGEQTQVALDAGLIEAVYDRSIDRAFADLSEAIEESGVELPGRASEKRGRIE